MKQRDRTCLQPFAVCCLPFDGCQALQESQLCRGVHFPEGLQALPGQTPRQTPQQRPRQRPTAAASQSACVTCTQDSTFTTADASCMYSNLIPQLHNLAQLVLGYM